MSKITAEEFERKAGEKFKGKFKYHQDYKGVNCKVKITCPIHGDFHQNAYTHLKSKFGCAKCAFDGNLDHKKFSVEDFEKKANEKFNGKFTYFQDYTTTDGEIKIECPLHGVFHTTAKGHLKSKYGCAECYKIGRQRFKTVGEFEEFCSEKFEGRFKYHQDYKGTNSLIKITCPIHGEEYIQANHHIRSNYGCPKCGHERIKEKK